LSIIPGPSVSQAEPEAAVWGDDEEQTPSSATVSQPQVGRTVKDGPSLEDWTVQDVLQLVDTFQSVFGVLHPLPHIESLKLNASTLLRAAKRSLWTRPIKPGQCGLLEILKITMAIAIVAQNGSQTELSRTLYRSLEPMVHAAVFGRTMSHDFRALLLLVVREP
jgi:hypothetical protein